MKKNTVESFLDSVDVSTRAKRRKAMVLVVELLEVIRHAEERYMERIPLNLQSGSAYSDSEYSIDIIIDAIGDLMNAYEP
jgi:hypothetical protein